MKRPRLHPPFLIGAALLWVPLPLLAGMPVYGLDEVGGMRLEVISFFAVCILVFTALLKLCWNCLRKDFPRMPRLTYWKSLALVFILGSLFMFILTMISGARELLTPGAWEKEGHTYKLTERR